MKSRHLIRHLLGLTALLILLFSFGPVAWAQTTTQGAEEDPFIQVSEQGIVDGRVLIVQTFTNAPAWVVIHADADGKPGPVIGHAALETGLNTDVVVEIDVEAATPLLHAMLHVDEGVVGTYEFPGPDVPMTLDDNIVMAIFSAAPPLAPEATPTAIAEEETAAEAAEATPVPAEEAPAEEAQAAEPTAPAEEETEAAAATAAPAEEAATTMSGSADAAAKGAPTALPVTGAGASLPMIWTAIAAVVAALGGSVFITRRRS